MRVVVASRNPVKLRAAERAFARALDGEEPAVVPVDVPSGVPAQPVNDAQTRRGAQNRAAGARAAMPDADWWVGIEGGVEGDAGTMLAFAWVCVLSPRQRGRARSLAFALPAAVAERVADGMELGQADDEVFGRVDSKRRDGAIGLLTRGLIDRTALYEPAVIAALIPALNPALYESAVRPSTDEPRET